MSFQKYSRPLGSGHLHEIDVASSECKELMVSQKFELLGQRRRPIGKPFGVSGIIRNDEK